MKVGKRANSQSAKTVNPKKNHSSKNLLIVGVLVITVLLIVWVYTMGRKAEETVSVVMLAEDVYKNEVITESMLKEYKMLKGEFEKYAVEQSDGTMSRRIMLWDERQYILGWFAAYPLHQDTVAMYTDFIASRTDNSDTVLYSYPGKNILSLEVGTTELQTFKTFLEPGDRINITAIYSIEDEIFVMNENGEMEREQVETFKEEQVFTDITVADLLNTNGDSILDIYASYRDKTVYEQAMLDASDEFKSSVQPASMLVALTPEEEVLYYSYLSKSDVEFRVSLPQRVD